jgi:hypothetical protein
MSEQRAEAADIEQRYVGEQQQTEDMLEGLDPEDTDRDAVEEVEAVGDDVEPHIEKMARNDP